MQDPVGTFLLQPVHVVVFGLFTLTMINYYFSLQSLSNNICFCFFFMFCTALTELLPGILNQLVRIFVFFFISSFHRTL